MKKVFLGGLISEGNEIFTVLFVNYEIAFVLEIRRHLRESADIFAISFAMP
jgi:hypothetical protein